MPFVADKPSRSGSGFVPDAPRFVPDGPSPYAEVIAEAQANAARPNPLATAIINDEGGTLATDNPAVYRPSELGKMALRVGVPLTVGVGTGGLGLLPAIALTGATGALTEGAAQGLEIAGGEREGISGSQIAASGLLNAVPGLPLTRFASPITRAGIRVAEGVGLGAAYPVIESGLRGELPQIGDVGTGALFGGAIGTLPGGMELARGRTFGRAPTTMIPSELDVVGRTMREPLPPEGIIPTNMILPDELKAVGQTRAATEAERNMAEQSRALSERIRGENIDAAKVRALGERMAGKSPQDQLSILEQEMRLQKDTLSLAEQRAGLDMKIELKRQIEAQKALESAADAEQAAIAQAQRGISEAAAVPELPKSQQILEQASAPPPLANVATEVATQTKQSPYALQGAINGMTGVPPPAPVAPKFDLGPEYVPVTVERLKAEGATRITTPAQNAEMFKKYGPPNSIDSGDPTKMFGGREGRYYADENGKLVAYDLGAAAIEPTPPAALAQVVEPGTPAPATFIGIQEGVGKAKGFELYNLTQDIPGHNAGSTVSRETLEKAGFEVPKQPKKLPLARTYYRGEPTAGSPDGTDRFYSSSREVAENYAGQLGGGDEGIVTKHKPSEFPKKLYDAVDKETLAEEIGLSVDPTDFGFDAAAKAILQKQGYEGIRYTNGTFDADEVHVFGKPKPTKQNALQEPSPAALPLRESPEGGAGVRPADAADQAVTGARAPGNEVRQEAVQEPLSRPTAELRLNNAGIDLPPISSLSAAQKLAELQSAGVTTYKGKPIADANPAQLSAALGQQRRGQLERGAVSARALAPVAGAGAGGTLGYTSTEQQPGESDEAFQARRLRNAAIGAAAGAGVAAGIGSLASGAQARRAAQAAISPSVKLPEPGAGQGIRQTAEKVIENRSYPEKLRQTLADDPDILYDKFALSELSDRVSAATIPELQSMLSSANIRERLGAVAELANRYSLDADPAVQAEGARLYSELAQNLTNPAQLLGLGKLVKTPQGFVTAINAALKNVKRTLSVDQEKRLNKLASDSIKAERELAAAERAAEKDFSEVNEAAYKAAQLKSGTAKKALDDFVQQVSPETWGEITSKIIQGNLMAPLSFVKNVYGNLVYQPVLRGVDSIASALDIVMSAATGRPRKIDLLNPIPGARELEAAADGIVLAGKEMVTGPSADSYIKAEVQRGFKPLRSLVSAFTGKNLAVRPDGTVALNDRLKKLVEGTLGVPPEISFRLLSLGDKGPRRASEIRILLEQARLRGLTGRDLDKFIEFPDKATQELVNTEGRSAIFAQENALSSKLTPLLDKGIAEFLGLSRYPAATEANKVLGRLIVPFRNFPINFVSTAINFAVPEVGLARALFESAKGNRREALRHIGEATIGATMLAGGKYLWEKGIISEPADKDAKQRSVQYEMMGPQRLNVSALKRLSEGGDPSYQLGDDTRDWGSLGIPAATFYVFTSRAAKGKNEAARVGEKPSGKYAMDTISSIPGMASFAFDQSFLSGTSAFLEALKNWDDNGDKFTQNMFRAITSIPAPNSLEAYARTQYEYIPELKGDSLTETLGNVWDYKTMQLPQSSRSNLKRDLWGEPLRRTPEGKNPYVNQFLDVTKSERKPADPFKQALIDLYKQVGTPDVYPTLPTRMFSLAGTTVELKPDDYNTLQALTGAIRREVAETVVTDPFFTDPATLPEEKIIALKKAYDAGAKQAKGLMIQQPGFLERYPELLGARIEGDDSRVLSRDPASRARLRMSVEQTQPR